MARRCELTNKRYQSGNNVSHSKRATRREFRPNLHQVTLYSEALGKSFKLKLAASTIRTIDHNDGLDSFLLKSSNGDLSDSAVRIKKQILAKTGNIKTESKSKSKKPAAKESTKKAEVNK